MGSSDKNNMHSFRGASGGREMALPSTHGRSAIKTAVECAAELNDERQDNSRRLPRPFTGTFRLSGSALLDVVRHADRDHT